MRCMLACAIFSVREGVYSCVGGLHSPMLAYVVIVFCCCFSKFSVTAICWFNLFFFFCADSVCLSWSVVSRCSMSSTLLCFYFLSSDSSHECFGVCWSERTRWLSGRASNFGARGPVLEHHDRPIVSLSKTL